VLLGAALFALFANGMDYSEHESVV
jgi:hypothetical protein